MTPKLPRSLLLSVAVLAGVLPSAKVGAQSPAPPAATPAATPEEEAIQLSPFQVDATKDKGYRATNSISGSRLNTAIKDIPMPIEVITEEFVKDTGSKDLRESLRYSAGIILRSQNDAGQGNTFVNAGGVHNSEGATAAKTQTTVKIRGFITDSVLRDGFRRQHSTDSANIGRIEVVRGPAALLYGIGNFGGIVNYLPKAPMTTDREEVTLGVGTNDYLRGAFDVNRSYAENMGLGVRVSGAVQTTGDHTELFKATHSFIAPIVQFKPFSSTLVTLDLEYGEDNREGVGFQSVRARADVPADQQDLRRHHRLQRALQGRAAARPRAFAPRRRQCLEHRVHRSRRGWRTPGRRRSDGLARQRPGPAPDARRQCVLRRYDLQCDLPVQLDGVSGKEQPRADAP
jgi:iron complex outermembrane recepter protein